MHSNARNYFLWILTYLISSTVLFSAEQDEFFRKKYNETMKSLLLSKGSEIEILAALFEKYSGQKVIISNQLKLYNYPIELKKNIENINVSDKQELINELKKVAVLNGLVFRDSADNGETISLQGLFLGIKNKPGSARSEIQLFRGDDMLPKDDEEIIYYEMKFVHLPVAHAMKKLQNHRGDLENYQATLVISNESKILFLDKVKNIKLLIEEKKKIDR